MNHSQHYAIGFLLVLGGLAVGVGCAGGRGPTSPAAAHDPKEMLPVGATAPDFALQDENGTWVRSADLLGKKNVVLIFYPGDNTMVCTAQLCAVRDDYEKFQQAQVAVFGVNPADAQSHRQFRDKYHYPFPLLVDSDRKVIDAFGCKGTLYLQRTVYGVDKSGVIVFAQRGRPTTDEILRAFAGKGS